MDAAQSMVLAIQVTVERLLCYRLSAHGDHISVLLSSLTRSASKTLEGGMAYTDVEREPLSEKCSTPPPDSPDSAPAPLWQRCVRRVRGSAGWTRRSPSDHESARSSGCT
jgi:hypothetical protein